MTQPLDRREFLSHASATALAAGAAAVLLPGRTPHLKADDVNDLATMPIIDTHQHLWDLSKFNIPWTKNEGVEVLNRDYLTADYLKATEGLNVVKAVYMEVDVHPDHQVKEAEHIKRLCASDDNPTVAAVISGRPSSPEFAAYIKKVADGKYIKGVRRVLHDAQIPAGLCLEPQFVKNVQLLGEMNLSYDLCMRSGEVIDTVKLVDQCPETRFILDHCGNMDVTSTDEKAINTWKRGVRELAERDNVICKISGIVVTAKPKTWKPADLAPVVNYCLDSFGPDRVVFGGDWPVCTLKASYAQWVNALKEIVSTRSAEEQRKLFHDNAVRHYGLS
ncbi:Amidohydrolase [Symmachiella dynata]|uniref:amidohydrolase family protein n=1 Tax=Symmachiella dynata TaxID=2527995 RepID=UPI0011891B76|nr:amidohydrolase family protein [Symmachiella dynata]QDT46775.1 Amidohydrolase [Symmachiella dynata]